MGIRRNRGWGRWSGWRIKVKRWGKRVEGC
jgi:hypothetical protein